MALQVRNLPSHPVRSSLFLVIACLSWIRELNPSNFEKIGPSPLSFKFSCARNWFDPHLGCSTPLLGGFLSLIPSFLGGFRFIDRSSCAGGIPGGKLPSRCVRCSLFSLISACCWAISCPPILTRSVLSLSSFLALEFGSIHSLDVPRLFLWFLYQILVNYGICLGRSVFDVSYGLARCYSTKIHNWMSLFRTAIQCCY